MDEHRGRFGVEPICSTLGVSASAYYQRKTGQRSARSLEDERLLERIREVHEANYCAYGYRRTWKALTRAGEQVPRCRVQRLMRAAGIQGAKRRGKPWRTTTPDPDARRRPDLVNRDFTARGPNELWVADFSVSALLGGRRVLQLRDRRLQPQGRGLAVRQHTCAPRSCSTRCGWRSPPGSACRRSGSFTIPTGDRNICPGTTRRRWSITTCSPRSGARVMPTTIQWPRASSIASRRSSSPIASGGPAARWSSPIVEYISWFNDSRLHENLDDRAPREIEELYAVKSREPIATS